MSSVRIDQLPPGLTVSEEHEVGAMKDGVTVKLTLAQVVTLAKAAILGTAPENLDTLQELAAALGDDADFAASMNSSIAQRLALSGGVMTGGIDMGSNPLTRVSSLNAGPLGGFRNWIINGEFTVNQRSGTKTPGVGVYGFDRWRGHADGLEQVVEQLPAGDYTLTFGGGGTGSVGGLTAQTSPAVFTVAGGNTSVVVPATATRVSLVRGNAVDEDDPFEDRPLLVEELLCYRYYVKDMGIANTGYGDAANQSARCYMNLSFPVPMRAVPSMSYTNVYSGNTNSNPFSGDLATNKLGMYCSAETTSAGANWHVSLITADAEF